VVETVESTRKTACFPAPVGNQIKEFLALLDILLKVRNNLHESSVAAPARHACAIKRMVARRSSLAEGPAGSGVT
jgi:hypothetical protein